MKVLRRQTYRNIKKEWFKYLSVFLLISLGLALIVSISGATDSIDIALGKLEKDSNVEDGCFSLFVPLNDKQVSVLENKGVELEDKFYVDLSEKKNNATIRVFQNRKKINLVQLKEGRLAASKDEIVLEQHYAKLHSFDMNDKIILNNKEYSIVGIGYSIDYDSLLEQPDGAYPDSDKFGTAFVDEITFSDICNSEKAEYEYSYRIHKQFNDDDLFNWLSEMDFDETKVEDQYMQKIIDDTNHDIQEFRIGADDVVIGSKDLYDGINSLGLPEQNSAALTNGAKKLTENSKALRDAVYDVADEYLTTDWQNLITFTKKEDNRRIIDFRDFASTNKYCALPIGIGLFLSLAFLVSVIAATDIKKQSRTIGTLYAMGYTSNELAACFLVVPVLIVTVASIVGTILGFKLVYLFTQSYVANGCIADLKTAYPLYLILYGVVMPPILALLVNWIVIKITLSKPVLFMLRNSNIETNTTGIGLPNMKFKKKFQFRLFFREKSGFILLFVSLIMTIFMMVFSVSLYGTLNTWVEACETDINYGHRYYYKFPSEDVPVGGEEAFYKTLQAKLDLTNTQLDVEVWGLQKNSGFFDFNLSGNKNEIYITDSTQDKFKWKVGDKIYLSSKMGNKCYAFTVAGIVDFSNGLYLFMDIDNMRKVFGEDENYWNLILSDEKLDIDSNRLAADITKSDVVTGAQRRTDSLMSIVYMLMGMGIFVFVGIFYIMMKIIMEKSINSISLLKIMGFSQGEVQQLYLMNPFIVVMISSAISIPFSKWLVSIIFPYIISGVTTGMPVVLPMDLLLILIGIIGVSWLVVHLVLIRKLCNIVPVELLRNNE